MLPLEAITVVSLEQAVAAPFASRQLADLGARVIKVERPEVGDFARNYDTTVHGQSSHFVWINRSKESIELDLKSEQGKEILKKLLKKADVFIQNLAPGAIERLGFDPEEVTKELPQLIICSISGYGNSGPYRDKKAYDLLIQCEAGLVSITGTEDTPSKAGISIADISAGMYAYSGILTALIQRQNTGKGSILNISMLEALGEWMGYPMYYAAYGGDEPSRTGASHATIYPYGPFQCGDEKAVFLGIQNEREWKRFCAEVLEKPSLANNEKYDSNFKRNQHKEELKKLIENEFKNITSEILTSRLDKSQIANARLNDMGSFFNHPQLNARTRWRDVNTPNGLIRALLPPATIAGLEPVMGAVPRVGEHTEKVLEELNITIKL
ncbi:CaiB/BaiF CoA transferase family protein [Peribacillus frigoritolerans]|uniref:CaiB/BaiF CoA transferase family protein n=1 Tax=Peribacillus frigoritolerans TaxID=450367 RepID=UPI0024167ACE|nr:CaiB/BaiF CoA-transferase family protein [Peribacillus frigoritolerans]MDG4850569.1 CaiB/BaiF CoA-transferase family protein [Peribacillus frigoritolerans]